MKWGNLLVKPKTETKKETPILFRLTFNAGFEFLNRRQRWAFFLSAITGRSIFGAMRMTLSRETIVDINSIVLKSMQEREEKTSLGLTIVR